MPQRGTFVTDYIYCGRCRDAVAEVLQVDSDSGWFYGRALDPDHIIAGLIKGDSPGDEVAMMKSRHAPVLAAAICHPLRLAVLGENGDSAIILIRPGEAPMWLAHCQPAL